MPTKLPLEYTYIHSDRFHDLVVALKRIVESDDEPRDKAITDALVEIGGVAPASWEAMHKEHAERLSRFAADEAELDAVVAEVDELIATKIGRTGAA